VLAERLLPMIRGGAGVADALAAAQAGTEYPSGAFGEVLLAEEVGLIAAFGEAIEAMTQATLLPPVAERLVFPIGAENWTLGGTLNDLRSTGLVRWRYDDTRPVDYLSGWVDHLFLNAVAPAGVQHETVWLSRNGRYRLRACDQARAHLGTLVTYYRRGLSEPLRFFPKSAWAYCAKLREDPSQALAAARAKWLGNTHTGYGEQHGAAYRQALRGVADPLDEAFEEAAVAVIAPLWESLDDERLP
jgi:exodeoxyribonuclease V gamma subunit